jgi:CheY-like chemotaxis protein
MTRARCDFCFAGSGTGGSRGFEANDGAMALTQLVACSPDVLVTDVTLPVMGGRELIERLRADPATASDPDRRRERPRGSVVVAGRGDRHQAVHVFRRAVRGAQRR